MSAKDTIPNTDIFPLTEGLIDFGDSSSTVPLVFPDPAQYVPRKGGAVDKARQAIRLKRLLFVCITAELYLLLLAALQSQGLMKGHTLITIASVVSIGMLVLYGIFASGMNQRVKEKNLTAPIAIFSLCTLLWTIYAAPQTQIVFAPFTFLIMAYAIYRLSQKKTLLLSASVLLGYGAIVVLQYQSQLSWADIKWAVLNWLVMAVSLPGFVMLAARVRKLHSALHKASVKIRNIEEHARRDQLLGCYNRRYIIAALEEQKRLADETGTSLCLAVIDLDHFKNINDEVGHLAGDEVLRTFARVAQQNVRQCDTLGRYGGEEFVLILPETPLLSALNIAERIRAEVERHCGQGKLRRPVTVSIGLTQYIPGESVLDLFSRTDTAMYLAKRGGRNQVVVEEPSIELWQAAEAELQV